MFNLATEFYDSDLLFPEFPKKEKKAILSSIPPIIMNYI
jgi:hypothetical protein